jgi:hypothetical protein
MKRSKFLRLSACFLVVITVLVISHIFHPLQADLVNAAGTPVVIYKAPTKSKVQRIMASGFLAADFVCDPNDEGANGMCYFAGPNDRSIAEKYNSFYKAGIIEVAIDQKTYFEKFKTWEKVYDRQGTGGSPRYELEVPQSLFPVLNSFPRRLTPN